MRVESDPPGARILIDGQPRGETPLSLSGIAFGKHKIELQKDGYRNYSVEQIFAAFKGSQPLKVALQPTSQVRLKLTPPDTAMLVDGQPAEVKDGVLTLTPGEHTYNFSRQGYIAEGRVETVPAGPSTLEVNLVPVTTGFVLVTTGPKDARVLVDGQPYDPHRELKAGKHQLLVRRQGYLDKRQSFELKAGETKQLDIRLVAAPQLRITCVPTASVHVNGQLRGKTPLVLKGLKEGPVSLKLTAEGYESSQKKVTLKGGDNKSVAFSLTKYTPIIVPVVPSYPGPSYPPPPISYPPPPPIPGPAATPDF
jgi:hypothetical protein